MKTFQVVVQEQSFSRAADQLGLVVSAVSRQVSDLEAYFNSQLLYRTTRSMHLTAEGRYYLEQFEEITNRIANLESRAAAVEQRLAGHLRITLPPDAELLGLTKLVSDFVKQHPAVKCSLMLLNRHVNLAEEGIDLAIRVGEPADSRLVARQFSTLNLLYVASPEYLAVHGGPSHPKALIDHSCVIDSSIRVPGRWRYFEHGLIHSVNVAGQMEVNQGRATAEFAAKGHGIAFLPDFLVQPYLDSGALVSILSTFHLPAVPVYLMYLPNRVKNPVLSELVRFLIDRRPC